MDTNQALLTEVQEKEEINFTHGTQVELHGSEAEQFVFEATMRLDQAAVEQSAFGIVIQYTTQAKLHIHFLKQEQWVFAVESVSISPAINRALTLPADFDPAQWNKLVVEQQAEQILIYLNDTLILSILETARPAQSAVITQNAAATFTNLVHIDTKAALALS